MKAQFFVDMHCHSSIKSYARSFRNDPGIQSENAANESSIWHVDRPTFFDKIKNYVATLTNFVQSDATSLLEGRVCLACLSFYTQERGFFVNKFGTGIPSDLLTILVTEFGKERIDYLQKMTSYWADLKNEMDYLVQREGETVSIDGRNVTYKIARSFDDVKVAMRSGQVGETLVVFIPTIEGAHIFDQVMDCNIPWDKYPAGITEDALKLVIQRVQDLRAGKDGMIRPAFMTFAHHFWNGLCGHERSLGNIVRCAINQDNGLHQGFMTSGRAVVHAMLDDLVVDGRNVPPIYIDIKHMSRKSREDYFEILKTLTKKIPVFVSHGGVTGLDKPGIGGTTRTPAAQEDLFYSEPINFYDDELLLIEETQGIFGIQLDERRIGSEHALRGARGHTRRSKILESWAKLVWNQIRHMAEVIDAAGRNTAWSIQTLGTDYDGIIDPINGYWTAASIDSLDGYLLQYAKDYMQNNCPLKLDANRNIDPEEIVERVLTNNALNFLSRIYK